jgi:hypothetical protein
MNKEAMRAQQCVTILTLIYLAEGWFQHYKSTTVLMRKLYCRPCLCDFVVQC